MVTLFLHNRPVETVFGLLGEKENDITFSVGWAVSRCEAFACRLIADMLPRALACQPDVVRLQQSSGDGGYTDIEILGSGFHCIIEAKKGWTLPTRRQLNRYAKRLDALPITKALAVFTESSPEYARLYLPKRIQGTPIIYRSWKQVERIATASLKYSTPTERRLLLDLKTYLRGLMNMQDHQSNRVFVVALSTKKPSWAKASTAEILQKHGKYFHPFGGGGWPVTPPNYLGFRYDGKLQSIHHVEKYNIVTWTNLHRHIPEIPREKWERDYIVYTVGPAIRPCLEVRTGKIFRSGHVWAALDLLLTSKTISDARAQTSKRLGNVE